MTPASTRRGDEARGAASGGLATHLPFPGFTNGIRRGEIEAETSIALRYFVRRQVDRSQTRGLNSTRLDSREAVRATSIVGIDIAGSTAQPVSHYGDR